MKKVIKIVAVFIFALILYISSDAIYSKIYQLYNAEKYYTIEEDFEHRENRSTYYNEYYYTYIANDYIVK